MFDLSGLGKLIITFLIILCLVVAGLTYGITWLATPKSIKSEKRINPKIELVIKNNKVDTLFVYEK